MVFLMKVDAIVPLEEFFEELSWNCVRRDDYIELRRETPLGEDWGFDLLYFDGTFKSLKEQVEYQFRGFDVEEEAGKFICARGKYGVPFSIRDLYEDTEWKRAKLEGLLGVLQTFAWIERISNGSDD